jgi:hypothetical protein
MIRYPVTEQELIDRINALAPTWLARARVKTERFRTAGRYNERSGTWSEIKDVYLEIQQSKCAYCERRLAWPPDGRIEHDVEHYRPKGDVTAWPANERSELAYGFPTGDAMPGGYYLLAYHVFNYATACKTCNSALKATFFPIAGTRGAPTDDPRAYAAERPFLPYPLGTLDEKPEQIITFDGTLPIPTAKTPTSVRNRRANVTIDFFKLDLREELIDERSERIVFLWTVLLDEESADAEISSAAQRTLAVLTAPNSPHCSCSRAYVKLFRADRPRAKQHFDAALEHLESKARRTGPG